MPWLIETEVEEENNRDTCTSSTSTSERSFPDSNYIDRRRQKVSDMNSMICEKNRSDDARPYRDGEEQATEYFVQYDVNQRGSFLQSGPGGQVRHHTNSNSRRPVTPFVQVGHKRQFTFVTEEFQKHKGPLVRKAYINPSHPIIQRQRKSAETLVIR